MNELLTTLTNAVTYTFRKDGMCPGITISTLKDGSIYCSIVRHGSGDGFKNGKQVVCKCTASDVETAVRALANLFLDKDPATKPNPIDELKKNLGR